MPEAPTSNSDYSYFNINQCRSFRQIIGATYEGLSAQQPCSEVIVIPSATMTFRDNGYTGTDEEFEVQADAEFTFRGLTNSNQLSAKGAGNLFYRTQYFSSNPAR
mgnify:FL=1